MLMSEFDTSCPSSRSFLAVSQEESGQKLLNFLQRRLNLPQAMLHRWIRGGQTRLNGARCKPFERVKHGDRVRIPPFARDLDPKEPRRIERGEIISHNSESSPLHFLSGEAPANILAINKPAGLPVQGGSGHEESVALELKKLFRGARFMPAPAHRLDMDTSGVLLIGASYEALRMLQINLANGAIHKEYLAWIKGKWPYAEPRLLRDYLLKTGENPPIRTCAASSPQGRLAMCVVSPLRAGVEKSLLHILLLTGRKHQIRVQLSSRNYPIIGDCRYGQPWGDAGFMLHSLRASMPGMFEFSCLPPWKGEFAVEKIPPSLDQNQV